jgi:adenylate cyclase
MKKDEIIVDWFEECTFICTDIVGFTEWSSKKEPEEVVKMLNCMFHSFDGLCETFGVEKIKTIGDCYIASSGCPTACKNHAETICRLGFSMIESLKVINERYGWDIKIRVGISTGKAVAGIIGKKNINYEPFGEAIQLTMLAESTGTPDKLHITKKVLFFMN